MSDSAENYAGESPGPPGKPVTAWQLDATVQYRVPEESKPETLAIELSKQLRDLAFAVTLRDTGVITERQLALVARDWTAFGTTSLSEHLVSQGVTSKEKATEVERVAAELLKLAAQRKSSTNGGGASDVSTEMIPLVNPDERVASLLGLSGGTMMQPGVVEDRRIGARYTLLRRLGQGGLGTVWLARDENLKRYVAVKELNDKCRSHDASLEHFRREAEITGRLEHPGIVPIYQFGVDEKSGKAFYAMRFLGRRTLQDAIDEYHERCETGCENRVLLHRLLAAFVSVCHSVGHAHAQKIVHRDLKPTNVALDEFGQVTLLDWGLSKVNDETGIYDVGGRTESGDLHDVGSAQCGRVIGTPLYMAPEQAAGRLEEVDQLTDVYGLGGILYTILTGVGPHQSVVEDAEPGIGRAEFLSRIVADEVTPPSRRVDGVPPELDAICMKAMAARRYKRYQSATELADDIQRYMAGTPVLAYQAPWRRRVSGWMTQHPTLAQMLLLSISLILIAGIAVAHTARQGRQRLVEARLASALETTRDLEANLAFEAQALERDLHFINELPLMEAITESHRIRPSEFAEEGISPPAELDASASSDATSPMPRPPAVVRDGTPLDPSIQTPAQWLARQSELFDGFLNANPSYLMMATCIRDRDGIRELVRSERASAGLRATRVPARQLNSTSIADEDAAAEFFRMLRPGFALLVTGDQLPSNVATNHRSPLVLNGVAAVYDSDGALFGINVIELDLGERLKTLLPAIAPDYIGVLVTDAAGQILIDYERGRFTSVTGTESIERRFPALAPLFMENATVREWGDSRRVFGVLIPFGPSRKAARIGIVAHVLD